jgi:hypothetical protein
MRSAHRLCLFRSAMRISWSTLTLLFSREMRRRRQPELGALAAGTAEQTPAGGDRTGAGSRRLNLVLVSRPPVWLTPGPGHCAGPEDRHAVATVLGRLHASPSTRQTMPGCYSSHCRHCAESQRRSNRGALSSPGPHRSERAAVTPASSSAHCTPMTAPAQGSGSSSHVVHAR